MRFRKLRILWSVAWGAMAVLLLAWWVQSYWRYNNYHRIVGGKYYAIELIRGVLEFDFGTGSSPPDAAVNFYTSEERYFRRYINDGKPTYWFHVPSSRTLVAPMWFPVLVAIVVTVWPWRRDLRWRFSLRTLLVATTVLAAFLGTISWLMKLR